MPEIWLPTKVTQDAIKTDTTDIKTVIASILAYVDTLESSLGQVGDAANANGSVNAKIKELRTLVDTVETTLATINTNTATAKSPIKSVQRGLATVNATTVNVTISAVNLSKSFVTISVSTGADSVSALARGRLTSATNLELKTVWSSTEVAWEVVEYV